MDTTADDNFFIADPHKLRNNFFNKDRTIQMVELFAQKYHDNTNRKMQLNRNQCRLTYNSNKKLCQQQQQQEQLQLQQQQQQPQQLQLQPQESQSHTSSKPQSFITILEKLCQATCDSDDIGVANKAVDTLVSASKSGCCFLERYMVLLLKFCTKKQPLSDTMKIKLDELMNKVLNVDFDKRQLTENLRNPKYKLTSVNHVIQLLRKVRDMLDYREQTAINWLFVILDAYFVELATSDEAADIVEQISAQIDFQCALLKRAENSKSLLKSILEQLDNGDRKGSEKDLQSKRRMRPYYSIDQIEF